MRGDMSVMGIVKRPTAGGRRWGQRIARRMLSIAGILAIAGVLVFAAGWVNSEALAAQEPAAAASQQPHQPGDEANLILPDLAQVQFMGGIDGRTLLMSGLLVSLLGLAFGFVIFGQLKALPVHRSMREISEL